MKKIILSLFMIMALVTLTGCGSKTVDNNKSDEPTIEAKKEKTKEEIYESAVDNLKNVTSYQAKETVDSKGKYYDNYYIMDIYVDRDNKLSTQDEEYSKSKPANSKTYTENPKMEGKYKSYYDFNTYRFINYDYQCGKGYIYTELEKERTIDNNQFYMFIINTNKDNITNVEDNVYSITANESIIKEFLVVPYESLKSIDAKVTIEDEKVSKIEYTVSYDLATENHIIEFVSFNETKLKLENGADKAIKYTVGQSCNG